MRPEARQGRYPDPMLAKPRHIIFDMDSTLVDSWSYTVEAFNVALEKRIGRRVEAPELVSFFGPPGRVVLSQWVGPDQAWEAYDEMNAWNAANVHRVALHPGILELLDGLDAAGVPYSIFTGRGINSTRYILHHHGVWERFTKVVTGNDIPRPKPDPAGIHAILEHHQLDPHGVWMVGDSPLDMMAARSAACVPIGACWDAFAMTIERPAGAVVEVEKPAGLLELMGEAAKV